MDKQLFLSKENKNKFVNNEPYIEQSPEGIVDFCLGSSLDEAKEIFKQFLKVSEKDR